MFLSKWKNSEPLHLVKGGTVVLSWDETKAALVKSKTNPAKIEFLGQDGKLYKLGDFAKTAEFGGGSGSGAGAALTKLTESAQAVYCAARWMGQTDYSPKDLEAAFKLSDTDESLSNVLNGLPDSWIDSCKVGAETLFKLFGQKQYTFHRGSKWVTRLENTFKKLNQREKVFANLNKWSPADIYMVSAAGAQIKFEDASTVLELNQILTEALKTKDIIGVSLKLLKKSAKVSYYNFDKSKPAIEFSHFTTGNKGFFGGKDVYLYFTENGKIQFRTFPETFQGEIKGKRANMGKLSYGPIQNILRSLKLPQLIDNKKLRASLDKQHPEIYNKFYENYTRYAQDTTRLSLKEFTEQCKEKGTSWCFSKYIGVELIDIIMKNHAGDDFIISCVQYASSSSELSAPFIKIE